MVSFRQAQELLLSQARSFGIEESGLGEAFGRVLAAPVRADRDYPPFPRATMDGYALRFGEFERGMRRFRVTEVLFPGIREKGPIASGECYKIMTGAAVPDDADMVIRREDVEEGETIEVNAAESGQWRPFLNIARRGEDLRSGDTVIDKPCRCSPGVIGLLATLGFSRVMLASLPRVALVTTGDEIVEPGRPVGPVQIRNSNRWMLEAALRREGIVPAVSRHLADDPVELKREIGAMLSEDMVILTGGVSAGDADHVPKVLTELGVRGLFHKIAMRPGKPTWCGVAPSGGIVFALPGNPFSCFVNFVMLIGPYLHACWGLEKEAPMSLPLRVARKKRVPLDEFFPVRMEGRPAMLTEMPLNSSGDIRLGLGANGLALHPAGCGGLEEGAEVEFYCLV